MSSTIVVSGESLNPKLEDFMIQLLKEIQARLDATKEEQ